MKKNLIFNGLIAGVALFATAQMAHADSIGLELISGTHSEALPIDVVDGVAGTGAVPITFQGWKITVNSATYPTLGTPDAPQIQTTTLDIDNTGGTTPLDIIFSTTDFTAVSGSGDALTTGFTANSLAGSISGSYSAYSSLSDAVLTNLTLLGGASQIGSTLTLSSVSSKTGGGSLPGSEPYSLAQEIVVTGHNGANMSVTASLDVPDGGMTMIMFGGALLGLAGFASLRTRKA